MVDVICFVMKQGFAFVPVDQAEVTIAIKYVLKFIIIFVGGVGSIGVQGYKGKNGKKKCGVRNFNFKGGVSDKGFRFKSVNGF